MEISPSAALLSALMAAVLFASSVLSAMIHRSNSIRLHHWAEEAGGRLKALYDRPDLFEAFGFLLSFVARISPVALLLCLVRVAPVPEGRPQLTLTYAALIVTLAVALVELINRRLVGHDPETILRRLTGVYSALLFLSRPFLPLVAPLVPVRTFTTPEEDEDEASDEEIDAFIAVGTREGILEASEGEMVRSVMDFGDTLVKSVMTPRIDLICMPVNTDLETLADRFLESGHSRIPLYEDSIDQIIGILHLRDLMRGLRNGGPPPSARELAKPVYFVPESKPLSEVLKELQERYQQMAVVVDEYGGTAGVVTVEDLLEEIVGEIVDEDDEPPHRAEQLEDGSWRFSGRCPVWELDEAFDLDLDDEVPYETVGGLVFSAFGYVPKEGESVTAYGLRLTVEGVDERRIQSVRVERLSEPAPAPEVVAEGG